MFEFLRKIFDDDKIAIGLCAVRKMRVKKHAKKMNYLKSYTTDFSKNFLL